MPKGLEGALGIADDNSSRFIHFQRPRQSATFLTRHVGIEADIVLGQEAVVILSKPSLPTDVVVAGGTRADQNRDRFSLGLTEFLGLAVIRYPTRLLPD